MTPRRTRARATAAVLFTGALALAGSAELAPAQSIRPNSPQASLQDASLYQIANPAPRVRQMAELGAEVIRVDMRWDLIATARPTDSRNPADPVYNWTAYDRIVSAARRFRVKLLFTVWGTPAWAADPSVAANPDFPGFSTRPRTASDFGRFGAAAARRYGRQGVHLWEAWNEPNIPIFLRPQYRRQGGRFIAVSPRTYSALAKSFYGEVRRVDRRARIGGPVTAPAGDLRPDSTDDRVTPSAFLRALSQRGMRPRFDFFSHHPYPLTPPRNRSFAGASFIDLYNIDRLQREVSRSYLRGRALWLTEFGFSTSPVPQYRFFVPESRQAAFLMDAYRRARANPRISLFTWYLLQDHPGWRSGLLRQNGSRKPSFNAFALPIGVASNRGGRVTLVGQSRSAVGRTTVTIQRRQGSRWVTQARVRTTVDGSFTLSFRPPGGTNSVRARWSGRTIVGSRVSRVSPPVRV